MEITYDYVTRFLPLNLARVFSRIWGQRIKLFIPILRFTSQYRMAKLTSTLLYTQLEIIQKGIPEFGKVACVFILPKAGFTEDIKASLGGKRNYRIIVLNRMIIKAICAAFLPKELDNDRYRSVSKDFTSAKKAYREFLIKILGHLKKRMKIDIMLTGNFGYYAEQELAAACTKLGIPFIALHKEGLKSPDLISFYKNLYQTRRSPFQGRLICVYNEIERRIQIDAGSFPANKIVVTGMPRLDPIHHLRIQQYNEADSKQVLFLSFSPKTGLPFIGRKTSDKFEELGGEMDRLGWWKLTQECHAAMVKLARLAPDIRVVIKTKDSKMALEAIKEIFGSDFICPENLVFVVGGDPLELIIKSCVVCGFNSTALFEAIAANIPVVVPHFAEAVDPVMSGYVVDLESAAERAISMDDLIEKLRIYATRERVHKSTLTLAQNCVLEKWVGNTDGRAGERFRRQIINIVADSETRRPK